MNLRRISNSLCIVAVLSLVACQAPARTLLPTVALPPIVTATQTQTAPTHTPVPTPTPTAIPSPTALPTALSIEAYPIIGSQNIAQLVQLDLLTTKLTNAYKFDIKDDRYVIMGGGWDNQAELWDLQANKMIRSYSTDQYGVFSPKDDIVAIASARSIEATVALQEIESGNEIMTLGGYKYPSYEFSWSGLTYTHDGRYLAAYLARATSGPSPIMIWDVSSGKVFKKLELFERPVSMPTFSSDDKLMAYKETNFFYQKPLLVLAGFPDLSVKWKANIQFSAVEFSPDSKSIAVISGPQIIIYAVSSGAILHKLSATGGASDMAFTADGKALIAFIGGSEEGAGLRVYSTETGDVMSNFIGIERASSLQLLNDGRTLVTYRYKESIYSKVEVRWYRVQP